MDTIVVAKVWLYTCQLRTHKGIFAKIQVAADDANEAKQIAQSWAATNHPETKVVNVDAKRMKFQGEFREVYIQVDR